MDLIYTLSPNIKDKSTFTSNDYVMKSLYDQASGDSFYGVAMTRNTWTHWTTQPIHQPKVMVSAFIGSAKNLQEAITQWNYLLRYLRKSPIQCGTRKKLF